MDEFSEHYGTYGSMIAQLVRVHVEQMAAQKIGARRHPNGELRVNEGTPLFEAMRADRDNWRNRYLMVMEAKVEHIHQLEEVAIQDHQENAQLTARVAELEARLAQREFDVRSLRAKLAHAKRAKSRRR